jgi:hypothetical protein
MAAAQASVALDPLQIDFDHAMNGVAAKNMGHFT